MRRTTRKKPALERVWEGLFPSRARKEGVTYASKKPLPHGRGSVLPIGFSHTFLVLALSITLMMETPALGQRRPRFAPGQQQQNRLQQRRQLQLEQMSAPQPPSVLIELSAPIANLFSRAEEGVGRADWKFAIDSLQRIIDDPKGSLVPRSDGAVGGGVLFETARRRAIRRLASLPDEGLRAYRLLFDGRAKRLLDEGISRHDPAPLRTVVNRYLLTRYGDDAADVLASWALDDDRPGEAVAFLKDVLELVPDRDVPESLIVAKLAAAYAVLGRAGEGQAVIERYRVEHPSDVDANLAATVAALAELSPVWQRLPAGVTALGDQDSTHWLEAGATLISWPVSGGSAARRGRQPATDPTLVDDAPWRYALPNSPTGAWRRVFQDEPGGRLYLPIAELVGDRLSSRSVDGGRLFARTKDGCVALNEDDLSPIWTTTDAVTEGESEAPALLRDAPNQWSVGRGSGISHGFDDFVERGIALGGDVVTVVARGGVGAYTQGGRDVGRRRLIPRIPLPGFLPMRPEGDRLVAFDARTGERRWQRGRTTDADDPLGDVDFRSPALGVGGALWVPYFKQNDLYVAVLDPKDGALIRNVLLGAMSGAELPEGYALPLAAADGLVFVPSGYGVLFAVDVSDYTVRWASQYATNLAGEPGTDWGRGAEWLPIAPVVTGGLVLLAPFEGEALMAFSAATGEWRWSASCRHCSYIIGADHERVWIGGRSVSCLSLADGKGIWSAEPPAAPTGRAVLCGGTVHVPVLDGMLAIDARTGATSAYPRLAESQDPLGNPLCVGGAMFVVDPSTVRKFPDLGRSFPEAVARRDADPSNVAAAVRLAWLHLFRGETQPAYDVLESISEKPVSDTESHADELAQVRVRTYTALAGQLADAGDPQGEALSLLEHAAAAARSPVDRLRTRLAAAERLTATGKRAEAYRRLWELGLTAEVEQVISLRANVEGVARFDIAERLRRIDEAMSEAERADVHRFTGEQAESALAALSGASANREEAERLRAIIDLDSSSSTGQRAMVALASHYIKGLQYEPAEQLLRASVRLDADRALTITALMRLCDLYLEVGSAGLEGSDVLRSDLAALESRFGDSVVPANLELSGLAGARIADGMTVRAWVERIRAEVFAAGPAPGAWNWDTPMGLNGELIWSLTWDPRAVPLRVLDFGFRPPLSVEGRIMTFGPGDVVSCYDAKNADALLWRATLRLPETFVPTAMPMFRGDVTPARRAVADAQTAVFSGSDGLFGVGLLTGRRLWVRPFELAGEEIESDGRDGTMAAAGGLLAAMPKTGRLTLMRLLDGATVWERDLRGERVEAIWIIGDRVVTVDPTMERVHLFDRATGGLVRRVLFDQPDREGDLLHVVATGGVVCGPSKSDVADEVLAVAVETGEPVWRTKLDKPVAQLFEAKPGYVGIGMHGGDVRIVDVSTGEALQDRRLSGTQKVIGGALIDGTLVLQYATNRDETLYGRLAAVDVVTGEELWRRDDVVSLSPGGELPKTVGGCTPVVITRASSGGHGRDVFLAMIDLRTGREVGSTFALAGAGAAPRLNGDVEIHPTAGILVVGGDDAVRGLRIEPSDNARRGL